MGKKWTQERRDAAKMAWTPERRKAHGDRLRGKRRPIRNRQNKNPEFMSEEYLIWVLTDLFVIGLRNPDKQIAVDNGIAFFRGELDRLRAGLSLTPSPPE